MACTAQSHVDDTPAAASVFLREKRLWETGGESVIVLPVLTRSAALMTLLLQDAAVDVELTSSVAALDPALAFAVLQLARDAVDADRNPVWRLPQALVAAGRDALRQLVQRAPRIEGGSKKSGRARLKNVVDKSVVRACVTHRLSRELGLSNPVEAFLCGLLLDLPTMAELTLSPKMISRPRLLSTLYRTLPAAMATAAVAGAELEDTGAGADPLVAVTLLGEGFLRARASTPSQAVERMTESPLWRRWEPIGSSQRADALRCCGEVAGWAAGTWQRMNPWEFLVRLERRNAWE